MLAVALRIGTRPELHHLLQLSTLTRDIRQPPADNPPATGQKKAP